MNFIGVDLHKKSITVCVMDETRKVLARQTLSCKETNEIVEFFRKFRPFKVVVEATASYLWFVELVEPLAEEVVLANTVRSDTKGAVDEVNAKFELFQRGKYSAANLAAMPDDPKAPVDLQQARNAVRIAKWQQADKYAPESLAKAQQSLDRAEDYYKRKQKNALPTAARLSYIDPEASIRMPSDTGRSSCRKLATFCGTPSSYTWKASRGSVLSAISSISPIASPELKPAAGPPTILAVGYRLYRPTSDAPTIGSIVTSVPSGTILLSWLRT